MMISVKTTHEFLAVIGLAVFILGSSLAWAGNTAFTECSLNELKVIEIDIEAAKVSLESPDGDAAVLMVGDTVGQEGATIIEIRKLMVILEVPQDDSGKTSKRYIPAVRIGFSGPLKSQ
ncbi:MAG: hypothetical protein R6W88_16160 [Desulfobacterales bacterium]